MIESKFTPEQDNFPSSPYTKLLNILDVQQNTSGTRYIVFADINKTTERSDTDNKSLYETLKNHRLGFVNVTSLSLREVIGLINDNIIQIPHAIATKNGTRIHATTPTAFIKHPKEIAMEDFVEDMQYAGRIKNSGFKKEELLSTTKQAFFPSVHEVFPAIDIDLQKEDRGNNWQTWGIIEDPFEVVCDVTIPNDISSATAEKFLQLAKDYYQGKNLFLLNNGKDKSGTTVKYGLFILPSGVGKDTALHYLFKKAQASGALFAGDSENDASALLGDYEQDAGRILRVVVGGASDELLTYVDRHAEAPRGRRNWKRLSLTDNQTLIYIEQGDLLGPASLNRAVSQAIKVAKRFDRPQ